MRDLYKGRWASFIGNAGVRALFNLDDFETAEYWSKFIGAHLVGTQSQQQDIYGLTKAQTVGEAMRPLLSPTKSCCNSASTKCWCCRKPRIRSSRIASPIGMIRPSKAFGTIRAARRQSPNRTRPALPLLGRSRNPRRSPSPAAPSRPQPPERPTPSAPAAPQPAAARPAGACRRAETRLLLVPLRLLSWRGPAPKGVMQRRRRAPPLRRAEPAPQPVATAPEPDEPAEVTVYEVDRRVRAMSLTSCFRMARSRCARRKARNASPRWRNCAAASGAANLTLHEGRA